MRKGDQLKVRMCSKGKTKKMIERGNEFIELVAENQEETEALRLIFHGVLEVPVLYRYHKYSFGYDRKMPKMSKQAKKADPEAWSGILEDGTIKQVLTFAKKAVP